MLRRFLLVVAVAGLAAGHASIAEAGPVYRAGRVHDLIPQRGMLVISELGAGNQERLVEVDIARADIVRVARDPRAPWRWLDRPISVARLAVGTFVVVIGRQVTSARLVASRVEVPLPLRLDTVP
ncbi:MAG: hypothetical protein HYR51_14740 [Candidatus Rokubacteria bacterium]|nr:hypothetical protein [Candidatus Rokubacteria bacterium]